jgi:hypothetical protein
MWPTLSQRLNHTNSLDIFYSGVEPHQLEVIAKLSNVRARGRVSQAQVCVFVCLCLRAWLCAGCSVLSEKTNVCLQLAQELLAADVWAYPQTFAETGCIASLEAQRAGCVVIARNFTSLPEMIGDR